MLRIERKIYFFKPWYKDLIPKRMNPKMKGRETIIGWLGHIFYFEKNKEQKTFIYCPICRTELISTNSYIGSDENNLEHFKCSVCRAHTEWSFDEPCPVLIKIVEYPIEEYYTDYKIPRKYI